ncbi:hypothetical protein A2U01_0095480, partial [Trifolium medium]|nr:hypothetical protein [Trifolium medium]
AQPAFPTVLVVVVSFSASATQQVFFGTDLEVLSGWCCLHSGEIRWCGGGGGGEALVVCVVAGFVRGSGS